MVAGHILTAVRLEHGNRFTPGIRTSHDSNGFPHPDVLKVLRKIDESTVIAGDSNEVKNQWPTDGPLIEPKKIACCYGRQC